jgi:hypothetical protein
MKKIIFILLIAVMSPLLCSLAHGWTVTVHNDYVHDVRVYMIGHHLFWSTTDCEVTVHPGQEGKCVLPGGICPHGYDVYELPSGGGLKQLGESHDFWATKCWDTSLRIKSKGQVIWPE